MKKSIIRYSYACLAQDGLCNHPKGSYVCFRELLSSCYPDYWTFSRIIFAYIRSMIDGQYKQALQQCAFRIRLAVHNCAENGSEELIYRDALRFIIESVFVKDS